MYSEKVMEHSTNPKNIGEIKDADGKGTVGNPACGDDGSFGCGAAIEEYLNKK